VGSVGGVATDEDVVRINAKKSEHDDESKRIGTHSPVKYR
jgi:hypothetical protein